MYRLHCPLLKAGTHYPCSRAVSTAREHGCQFLTPVFTARVHGWYFWHPCDIFEARENGPWTRAVLPQNSGMTSVWRHTAIGLVLGVRIRVRVSVFHSVPPRSAYSINPDYRRTHRTSEWVIWVRKWGVNKGCPLSLRNRSGRGLCSHSGNVCFSLGLRFMFSI